MENSWSNGKMKVLKSRPSNENVLPLQIDSDERRGRYLQPTAMSPRFQAYTENIDAGLPLARYLFAGSRLSSKVASPGEGYFSPTFGARTAKALQHCGTSSVGSSSFGSCGRLSPSPLSSIENMEIASLMSPPMYRTPAVGDDDVIVMDDILVRSMSGGKGGRSSSSSSRGSSSSSSASRNMMKTEIFRVQEEFGNCRYNSKYQLNGGHIGFPPDHFSNKILCEEAQTSESSVEAGSSTPGQSNNIAHQQHAAAESDSEVATSHREVASQSEAQTSESSVEAGPSKHGPSSCIDNQQLAAAESDHEVATSHPEATTSQPTLPELQHTLTDSNTSNDWSPLDDNCITIVLPGSDNVPSREEVDAYISNIQHGRTGKRRLPVFQGICEGD